MRRNRLSSLGLVAALVACAAFSGCVIAPARPYYGAYGAYGADGPVMVAPPAPREEYIGIAPALGYIWLGGYWGWTGGRHEWVGGHWEAPRPGQRWVPHQWQREGGGWRLHQGHWERH